MSESDNHAAKTIDPATWVDRHGDLLYRYALSRLRDAESAEEVVQETFVAALTAVDQYAGTGAEGAWLLGILKRKIIDHVRQRSRAAAGEDAGDDLAEIIFDQKGNWRSDPRLFGNRPSAALEREEFWAIFRRCLEALPPRQADVFALRELEELSTDEICKDLQITASNLWVILYRARLQLARCIKSGLESGGDG